MACPWSRLDSCICPNWPNGPRSSSNRTPVGPIMHVHRAVPPLQKVEHLRAEHVHHPLLVSSEIHAAPSLIVAHQLARVGKLVTVNPGCQAHIGVSRHCLAGTRPSIQNLDGFIGIPGVAGNLPHQRALVGRGHIAVGIPIIGGIRFPDRSPVTDNLRRRGWFPVQVHMRTGHQPFISRHPRFLSRGQLFLHPVKVGLRVQDARMDEALRPAAQAERTKQQR